MFDELVCRTEHSILPIVTARETMKSLVYFILAEDRQNMAEAILAS